MLYLAPIPKQFVDAHGEPLSDGTVEVFHHGDTSHPNIYQDADGEALLPNPCRLDSHGAWVCFVADDVPYDYIVKDKDGNVIFSYQEVAVGGGEGGGTGPTPDDLWGHWLYEGEVFNVGNSEVDVSRQYVKVEGNIGGGPSSTPGPIHLPKGLYDFKLQVGFLAGNDTGYKWFDLKIKYGDQELRAMTFEFNDVAAQRWMDEFGCGVFKMEQEGDITITLKKVGGSSGNGQMRVPHFFVHEVDVPGYAGGGGAVDAELPIQIVDGKVTNNGSELTVTGENAWAEGFKTRASGQYSHSEGMHSDATGYTSHAEGKGTVASGSMAHSEGNETTASGYVSHAEGDGSSANANWAHAEGYRTEASSDASHAEGNSTEARGLYSHSEGIETEASAKAAHAEGGSTVASGQYSHAEGYGTEASADYSHASGIGTKAAAQGSTTVGKYNKDDQALFSVGEGTSNVDRKDAFKVDEHGNTWMKVAGTLKEFLETVVSGTTPISVTVNESGGYRVFNIGIPDGSIDRHKLSNWHYLVPDSRYVKFIDLGGNVVVSLEPDFLATLQTLLTAGDGINITGSTISATTQSDWAQTDVDALDYIKNKPAVMVHDAVQKYGSTWTGDDSIQIFGGRMTLKIEATTEGADPYKKVKFYLKANRGYHGADSWTCVAELFELSGGTPNILVNMLDGTDEYKSLSNGPGSTIEFPSDAFNAMLRLEIDYDYADGDPQNKRSHGTVYVQRGTSFLMVSTRYEESV